MAGPILVVRKRYMRSEGFKEDTKAIHLHTHHQPAGPVMHCLWDQAAKATLRRL